jgi:hypothetical protein
MHARENTNPHTPRMRGPVVLSGPNSAPTFQPPTQGGHSASFHVDPVSNQPARDEPASPPTEAIPHTAGHQDGDLSPRENPDDPR